MRLIVAALVLAGLTACMPRVSHYKYRVGVDVPETPEGHACKRQCLALFGVCSNYLHNGVAVTPLAGPYSEAHGCPGIVSDCMLTCDGAKVAADGPDLIPVEIKRPAHWGTSGSTYSAEHPYGY